MKNKKKGYVLAVVMLFSLLLAMVLVTTFAICYRYQRLAQRSLEELRQEVYKPAATDPTQPESGGDTTDPTLPDSGNPDETGGDTGETPTDPTAVNTQSGNNGTSKIGETEPNEQLAANADCLASNSTSATCRQTSQTCGERQG